MHFNLMSKMIGGRTCLYYNLSNFLIKLKFSLKLLTPKELVFNLLAQFAF